jgi:hypothetical protein
VIVRLTVKQTKLSVPRLVGSNPKRPESRILTKFTRPAGSARLNLVKSPVLRALQEENDYFRIPDDAEVHQFTDGSGAQRGTSFMRTA